jgi:hypothetical protein
MFPGTSFRISKKQPPPGYDAVVGEPGGDLNYDECIGRYKKTSRRLVTHANTDAVYNVSDRRKCSLMVC